MENLKRLRMSINTKDNWTTKELNAMIDRMIPKIKIIFAHIGGYELLRDGTQEEEINSMKALKELLEDVEFEYDENIKDPVELAKSIESQWEDRYDDGGGSGWIEYN